MTQYHHRKTERHRNIRLQRCWNDSTDQPSERRGYPIYIDDILLFLSLFLSLSLSLSLFPPVLHLNVGVSAYNRPIAIQHRSMRERRESVRVYPVPRGRGSIEGSECREGWRVRASRVAAMRWLARLQIALISFTRRPKRRRKAESERETEG